MDRIFDLIIVGGGHAGTEAAHSAAKLGLNTLLLTNSIDQIASMPCNPAIGGPAKSHLVKEIDAMGGLMGLAADATYLQMKTLNLSKGPAVQALRAQSDKREYSAWVRQYLEQMPNLTIYQSSAKALLFDETQNKPKVIGIQTQLDEKIFADCVVLTAGTFLEGRIFSGKKFEVAGRAGEKSSLGLSPSLRDFGLNTGRLKTGTPPRLDRRTIDFTLLEEAPGDKKLSWFSFLPNRPVRAQYPCHITRTNAQTHEIIMANLNESPMYSGMIDANGPRYCPSIEDKVVRFSQNPSHHFFLEPEGLSSNEIYLQGCSTSLPVEIQWQIVHSLPGCKNAVITRPAYAVEYDYFPAIQCLHSLETKCVENLFIAGQVLGTSGYEEAAAQGLIAGINAAIKSACIKSAKGLQVKNKKLLEYISKNESFVLGRETSYIATLIDDLVTKEINDPYRMLTSRSEYRLILRQDNADERLTPIARQIGLVDDFRMQVFDSKYDHIYHELRFCENYRLVVDDVNDILRKNNLEETSNKGGEKVLVADLLKRVDLNIELLELNEYLNSDKLDKNYLSRKRISIKEFKYPFETETRIKYAGYIERQKQHIKELAKIEKIKIPNDFDFKNCSLLSLEARDKLAKVQPKTLGQASRVGGVTPNDISVLIMLLAKPKQAV
jgi:tRNA uridine 5-carboxymethylaminomethyl modification enzyme